MAALKALITAALRKRLVLALTVGGVIFSSVYAFAATLSVGTDSLGAGNSVVASCAGSTTLTASYTTTYDSTFAGFRVSNVRLTANAGNIPAACANKSLTVNLAAPVASGSTSLGQVTTTLPASPGTYFDIAIPATGGTAPPTGTGVFPVHAQDVGNVSVVISG